MLRHARPSTIHQFSPLRGGIAFLYFCQDFVSLLGQPSFLHVQQENRVLHKPIHSLVRSAQYILPDHLFQVRTKLNLHGHSLPDRP